MVAGLRLVSAARRFSSFSWWSIAEGALLDLVQRAVPTCHLPRPTQAPPLPVTNGPYTAGPVYPEILQLSASASGCANPSCSYKVRPGCHAGPICCAAPHPH